MKGEKIMLRRLFLVGAVLLVFSALVSPVLAAPPPPPNTCLTADKQGHQIAIFCDKRLNAFDMMAPVVLYYHWKTGQLLDAKGKPYTANVVDGIEIWAVNSLSVGQMVGYVSSDKIKEAINAGQDAVLFDENGVVLGYSASKNFWVSAPGYKFNWKSSPPF
jgi:hypothetical protein